MSYSMNVAAGRRLRSLTVVAPFFNEQRGAVDFHRQLSAALVALPVEVGLVFVDDGSRDETLAVLHRIADQDPRVSVIALSRNWGHQIALTAGLEHAVGDAVVTMDSDLQHPPGVIAEMITAFEAGADIVYGVRRSAARVGWLKRVCSKAFYRLLRRATHVDVVPDAADFRLMSHRVVASLRQMREVHRYLRGMVPWLGFDSAIVYYDQPPRASGRAAYTLASSLRLARHAVFSFSRLPLVAISAMGVIFGLLAALYLVYVVMYAISGRTVPGWASVIAVVLVVSVVQFLSMSVIAQYLGMLFEQVKERPLYVLKDVRLAAATPRRDPDDA
jgi:glycosyltransferase involved in cell wall biosynthesis